MNFKFSKLFFVIAFLIVLLESTIFSCKSNDEEGKALAKIYCSGCHLLPDPSILPKNVWKLSTLPYMAIMLGVDEDIKSLEKPLSDYAILRPSGQMISDDDWKKIKKYYLNNAPKTLEIPKDNNLESLDLFQIQSVNNPHSKIPNFTEIRVDTINQKIIAGDQSNREIIILNKKGEVENKIENQDALTNVNLSFAKENQYLLTFIGTTTQANPDVNGHSEIVEFRKNEIVHKKIVIPNLYRPLEVIESNLDESPDNELISLEFGFKTGGLSIYKKAKNGTLQKQILNPQTGATKAIVEDFDGDKRNDILALFAQGDEKIILYLNKGKMQFEEKILLRFPPIYGSSSFDITDINKDGKIDIVCTAGDNADFSTILKPYHGVYVFENLGDFKFKQTYFFHQNGATKVIPADFDNDGDIDLASIALFPDTDHRPEEGFIYFENTGSGFTQKTMSINHLGRWSVMDAADIDRDGDIDIVLGSHPVAKFPSGFDQAWKEGSGLLILRNKLK
jgi:hypothetical protein